MKTKICLCALLLAHSAPATLIDFDDIAIGTEVSSLNPYGNAVISTRLWVTQGGINGPTVAESFTRGVIGLGPNGSPSVVLEASSADRVGDDPTWQIDIAVSFKAPVSTFSVDAYSQVYTSHLIYSGFDALGAPFTLSSLMGGGPSVFDHFDIVAPTGGHITGFHFSQWENGGPILLAMDNLSVRQCQSGQRPRALPPSSWTR